MLKKEYDAEKKDIASLCKEDLEQAADLALYLIAALYENKKYKWIVDLYKSGLFPDKTTLHTFETAYSLNEEKEVEEARVVYEVLLEDQPNSSAILNNLHIIYKNQGNRDKAWELISKAHQSNPDDKTAERNYKTLLNQIQEIAEQEAVFNVAIEKLSKENSFVLEKLSNFLMAAKNDEDYSDDRMPIPRWKLKVMMKTDEQKSVSLIQQWIDKGYVSKTGNRGAYGEPEYLINPKIFPAMNTQTTVKLPEKWILGINKVNQSELIDIGYYDALEKIPDIEDNFREKIRRDLDELYLNIIFRNSKSVIVLSGSLTEMLLIYYLHSKGFTEVEYKKETKKVKKKLLDSTLFDLLNFCEQESFLKNITVNLGNVSRLYRNYIHPGKEIKDNDKLDFNKATLCYSATMEIFHTVL